MSTESINLNFDAFFGETNLFYISVQKETRNTHTIHALLWKISSSRDFSESCCASAYINFIFTCTLSWSPTGSSHEDPPPFQPETMWRNHSELESCTVFFARIFLYLLCVNFFGFVLQKSVSQKSEQTAHAEGLKTMVNRSRHEPYCLAHRRRRC